MMTREAPESRSPTGHLSLRRLMPIAGASLVGVMVLGHLVGGAALLHLGRLEQLGGGALAVGIAALVSVKVLVVFVARQRLRRR